MASSSERVIERKEGPVGWVIFNNPARRNAVSLDMWEAMPGVFDELAADPAIRVVVLAGAGDKAFVSGADISQFEQQRASKEAVAHYEHMSAQAHAAMKRVSKPIVAMIRGYCIGGGMSVALGCDLRIAAADARFAVPAAKLGLGYAFSGVKKLVDLVGPAFAKEIYFTGRQFDAEEARQIGLVNRVVPVEALESTVRELAATIAANAPLTVKATKLAADAALEDAAKRDMDRIETAIEACFASQDYIEGRRAFMEKRKPVFKGA